MELGQHGRPVGPAVKPALPGPRAPLGRLASFFRDFGYIFASVFLTFIRELFGAVPSSQGRACLFPARLCTQPASAWACCVPREEDGASAVASDGLQHWAQRLAESEQAVPALGGGCG